MLLLLALTLVPLPLSAQGVLHPEDYTNPQLEWKTITTPHFTVSYHKNSYNGTPGAERTAKLAAKIAEEAYPAITKLYNFEPDGKVNIFIKDMHDYSNGAAYFFENKIEIWAPQLEFELRGQHNWLRNVITHEFTHIVTINAAMKFGRTIPAIYFQAFGYEQVRRPDVLYGFPNVLISYPVAGVNVPFWLAEGVAQYQRRQLPYETWDSHRDMILRSLVLDKKLFDLNQLSNFSSKRRIEFEYTYNSGFALTRYLAEKYGEGTLESLCKNLAAVSSFNIHDAIWATYSRPSTEIYDEWKQFLETDYAARIDAVRKNVVQGTIVEKVGTANYYPVFSPDGNKLYYASSGSADFGGTFIVEQQLRRDGNRIADTNFTETRRDAKRPTYRDLLASAGAWEDDGALSHHALGRCRSCGYHFAASEGEVLMPSGARIQLSADSTKLLYHRYQGTSGAVQNLNDIFYYDLTADKETRLTYQKRLEMPSPSRDGKRFVAAHQSDGTSNLVESNLTADTAAQAMRRLTAFRHGEGVFAPVYSADGKTIYFALGIKNQRRLMALDRETLVMTPLPTGAFASATDTLTAIDERDASVSPDGKFLYFSSDRTGIFNIYRYGFETGQTEQLTNVVGGAFMPNVDANGNLAYSLFTSDGYKIALLNQPVPLSAPSAAYIRTASLPEPIEKSKPETQPTRFASASLTAPAALSASASIAGSGNSSVRSDTLAAGEGKAAPSMDWKKLSEYDDTVAPPYEEKDYEAIFGSLLVLPIVRFDNYARSQGSFLKDTWRATKLGVAFNSSEVLGRLNLFGSFTIAPGSGVSGGQGGVATVFELERDAYLSFEYNEASFLPSSMLTQFALEVYHQTRNVQDGAEIKSDDFLATAKANVFYTLTEFDLSMKFRIPIENLFFNRSTFKLQFSISPYTSKVGSFPFRANDASPEQIVTSSASNYYIGRMASLFWNLNLLPRTANSVINPVGLVSRFRLDWENSSLQNGTDVSQNGTLVPLYENYIFARAQLDLNLHIPLPAWKHTLTLRSFSAMSFSRRPLNQFFDNFISGLLGMRGYEFYAIGGEKATMLHAEYRIPVLERLNLQVAQLYFDKLYASAYFDIGAAWRNNQFPSLNDFRKDVGVELRLEAPSFYLFPTRFFFSATYGLDRFSQNLNNNFVTPDGKDFVTYGGEWKFHVGVLFAFDLLTDGFQRTMRGLMP